MVTNKTTLNKMNDQRLEVITNLVYLRPAQSW